MKKGKGISKETLRGISEGMTGVTVDEEERGEMLIRIGELLDGIKALDEIELNGVQPAFSYNPEGGRNGAD
jgi:hypothetical protein